MSLNKLVVFDKTLPTFDKRVKELVGEDARMLSLSTYGDPKDPRFSAVWDDRPSRVLPLKHVLGKSLEDFKEIYDDNIAKKFFPLLVSATGGGSNAFSGVFEKVTTGGTPTEMTFDHTPIT